MNHDWIADVFEIPKCEISKGLKNVGARAGRLPVNDQVAATGHS